MPVDRIAQPWGSRTPYGPGEDWPTRVDTYLADGLQPDDVDEWVQSATILHSNGDALDIAVRDGRMVGVRGRAVDRVNRGRLGPKDLTRLSTNCAMRALASGGKCRSTYSCPATSPSAPSTREIPRFQRTRCCGVPLSVRP